MADIFISYAREDVQAVGRLALALQAAGYTLWWDQNLAGGTRYLKETEAELKSAKAVVVVWTKHSIGSHWVADEAGVGRDGGRLVPLSLDGSMPPLGFRQFQVLDLAGWQSGRGEPHRRLLESLARHVAPSAANSSAPESEARSAAKNALVTVAVLPFVNMSSDREQEYFSDGLSEELINQLTQLRGLQVAGRTSSFVYKGQNEDVRAIGLRLGVGHVLEGSVRKAGARLRITAQLVKCEDGYHLWSQTYDRELDDVFAIQDEIAGAVASALSVTLGIGSPTLDYGGTRNFDAYDKFLKGRLSGAQFDLPQLRAHAASLRQAVAIDPNYALAWANLSICLARLRGLMSASDARSFETERDEATRRALALASDLPSANVGEGWRQADRRNWQAAEEAFQRAISGHDPMAAGIAGGYLTSTGRVQEGLRFRERMRDSDPLSLGWADLALSSYLVLGLWEKFDAEYKRSQDLHGNRGRIEFWQLMRLMMDKADPAQVKIQFARVASGPATEVVLQEVAPVHHAREQAIAVLRKHLGAPHGQILILAQLAGVFGDKDLAIEALRQAAPDAGVASLQLLWLPALREARADPRFKDIVRDLGLAQFWRASGKWPDFARALGGDDFEVFR